MAIRFVGAATAGNEDEDRVTPLVTPHKRTVAGDFMLAVIAIRDTGSDISGTPPGWEPHESLQGLDAGETVRCWLYFKAAGSNEPPTQWAFDDMTRSSLSIVTYRGVAISNPFDSELSTYKTTDGFEGAISVPGVVTRSDDSMLVAVHARGGSTERPEVIQREGLMVHSSSVTGTLVDTWYEQWPAVGETGERSFMDPDSPIDWVAGLVALRAGEQTRSDSTPAPRITSVTAESSSSLRIVWEDGEPA